jgi:hypothetical protein
MEDFSGEFLTAFFAFVCGVPAFLMLFLGLVVYEYSYRRPKFMAAVHKLAHLFDFVPVTLKDRLPWGVDAQQGYTWYTGEYKGHTVAIKPVLHKDRRALTLRVAMSINVPKPLGITLFRSRNRWNYPRSFGRAFPRLQNLFGQKNVDRLSPEARRALLAFLQQGERRTGFWRGLFPFRIGRNIRLMDRHKTLSYLLLPSDLLPETAVILIHQWPLSLSEAMLGTEIASEELRQLLDDMVVVADVIEMETSPVKLIFEAI